MLRIVILVVAVVVLLVLLRASLRRTRRPDDAAPPRADAPAPVAAPQPMIACAHCGVHLPRADAVLAASGTFCGEAHRIAWEREHPAA